MRYPVFFTIASLTLLHMGGCSHSTLPPQVAQVTPTATEESPASNGKEEQPPAEPEPPVTEDITWERLDIGMEPDSVYQPWMLKHQVKVLEGKPVRIKGFMHGAVFQRNNIRTFFLLREIDCPFGPGGQAHHAIEVELQGKLRTSFNNQERTVEGIFSVVPMKGENGNTWSLYRIAGTSIE
ncbi:hypothetical protein NA78x_001959 [Anatilimnocola sp. NA78]|uniref:hypothetical protein n=1 Tax=Anatilimnocola sp. NA78 TaxID=3415683 RepID=UPI003CE5A8D1